MTTTHKETEPMTEQATSDDWETGAQWGETSLAIDDWAGDTLKIVWGEFPSIDIIHGDAYHPHRAGETQSVEFTDRAQWVEVRAAIDRVIAGFDETANGKEINE